MVSVVELIMCETNSLTHYLFAFHVFSFTSSLSCVFQLRNIFLIDIEHIVAVGLTEGLEVVDQWWSSGSLCVCVCEVWGGF